MNKLLLMEENYFNDLKLDASAQIQNLSFSSFKEINIDSKLICKSETSFTSFTKDKVNQYIYYYK